MDCTFGLFTGLRITHKNMRKNKKWTVDIRLTTRGINLYTLHWNVGCSIVGSGPGNRKYTWTTLYKWIRVCTSHDRLYKVLLEQSCTVVNKWTRRLINPVAALVSVQATSGLWFYKTASEADRSKQQAVHTFIPSILIKFLHRCMLLYGAPHLFELFGITRTARLVCIHVAEMPSVLSFLTNRTLISTSYSVRVPTVSWALFFCHKFVASTDSESLCPNVTILL